MVGKTVITFRNIFTCLTLCPVCIAALGQTGTGQVPAINGVSTLQEPVADSAVTIRRYQSLIAQLEAEQGVYHAGLVEVLSKLGQLFLAADNYKEAVTVLERAYQVSRVNKGLYNLDQLAILELLIKSYTELHNWSMVDKNLQNLYWVYLRNYGDNDIRLVPVINRIGQWRIQAYLSDINGQSVGNLVIADDLYDKAADITENQQQTQIDRLVDILYHTAVINYYIAINVNDRFKMSHREIREVMIPNGRGSPYMNEQAVREYYFDQSFFKGRRAAKRIIELYENNLPASVMQYAQALIFLGDWYLVFRWKFDALKNYEKAYRVLTENGIPENKINELFGEPKPLTQLTIPGDNNLNINDHLPYVEAVIDVPSNGWPSNIRIVETSSDNDPKIYKRGELAIAGVRYRPRFVAGKPVATTDVSLRYVFNE